MYRMVYATYPFSYNRSSSSGLRNWATVNWWCYPLAVLVFKCWAVGQIILRAILPYHDVFPHAHAGVARRNLAHMRHDRWDGRRLDNQRSLVVGLAGDMSIHNATLLLLFAGGLEVGVLQHWLFDMFGFAGFLFAPSVQDLTNFDLNLTYIIQKLNQNLPWSASPFGCNQKPSGSQTCHIQLSWTPVSLALSHTSTRGHIINLRFIAFPSLSNTHQHFDTASQVQAGGNRF